MPAHGSNSVGDAKLQRVIITSLNQNLVILLLTGFYQGRSIQGGKENILVMKDAFIKFSVAVTTNNQQALTVAKALVECWFYVYGIPSRSDQGRSFDNKIIDALCKMYGVERTMTSPYNLEGWNKIQDDYKPDLFEVTGKHPDPNAFFVKPLDGKGPVKQVN